MSTLSPLYNGYNARNAVIGTWVLVILSAILLYLNFVQYGIIQDAKIGNLDQAKVQANDTYKQVVVVILVIVFITTNILFSIWLNRAYGNIDRMGLHQSYRQPWVIWAWFVPFMNLYTPYEIMVEIYKQTQYARTEDTQRPKSVAFLGWWWFLFIVISIFSNLVSIFESETLEQIEMVTIAAIISILCLIGYYLFGIYVIRRIASEEQATYEYYEKNAYNSQFIQDTSNFENLDTENPV